MCVILQRTMATANTNCLKNRTKSPPTLIFCVKWKARVSDVNKNPYFRKFKRTDIPHFIHTKKMKKFFAITIAALAVMPAIAQRNVTIKADKAFEAGKYFDAVDEYKYAYAKAKDKDKKNDIMFMVAKPKSGTARSSRKTTATRWQRSTLPTPSAPRASMRRQ